MLVHKNAQEDLDGEINTMTILSKAYQILRSALCNWFGLQCIFLYVSINSGDSIADVALQAVASTFME